MSITEDDFLKLIQRGELPQIEFSNEELSVAQVAEKLALPRKPFSKHYQQVDETPILTTSHTKRVFLGGLYEELPPYATKEHVALAKQISQLEQNNFLKTQEADDLNLRIEVLVQEIDSTTKQIERFDQLKVEYQLYFESQDTKRVDLNSQIEKLNTQIESQKGNQKILESQKKKLLKRLESNKAQVGIFQAKHSEFEKLFETYCERIEELQVKVSQLDDTNELNQLSSEILNIRKFNDDIRNKIQNHEEQLEGLAVNNNNIMIQRDQLAESNQKFENDCSRVRDSWYALNSQINSNQELVSRQLNQIESLKTQLGIHKRQHAEVVANNLRLETNFKRITSQKQFSISLMASQKEAKTKAEIQLSEYENQQTIFAQAIQELSSQIVNTNVDLQQVQEDMKEMQKKCSLEKINLKNITLEIAKLKNETNKQEITIHEAQKYLDAFAKETTLIQRESRDLNRMLVVQNQNLEICQSNFFNISAVVSSLKKQMKKKQEEIQSQTLEFEKQQFFIYEQQILMSKLSSKIRKGRQGADAFLNSQLLKEKKGLLEQLNTLNTRIQSENSFIEEGLKQIQFGMKNRQQVCSMLNSKFIETQSKLAEIRDQSKRMANQLTSANNHVYDLTQKSTLLSFNISTNLKRLEIEQEKTQKMEQKVVSYLEELSQKIFQNEKSLAKHAQNLRAQDTILNGFIREYHSQTTTHDLLVSRLENIMLALYNNKHVKPNESWDEFCVRINNENATSIQDLKNSQINLKKIEKSVTQLVKTCEIIHGQNSKLAQKILSIFDQLEECGYQTKTDANGNIVPLLDYYQDFENLVIPEQPDIDSILMNAEKDLEMSSFSSVSNKSPKFSFHIISAHVKYVEKQLAEKSSQLETFTQQLQTMNKSIKQFETIFLQMDQSIQQIQSQLLQVHTRREEQIESINRSIKLLRPTLKGFAKELLKLGLDKIAKDCVESVPYFLLYQSCLSFVLYSTMLDVFEPFSNLKQYLYNKYKQFDQVEVSELSDNTKDSFDIDTSTDSDTSRKNHVNMIHQPQYTNRKHFVELFDHFSINVHKFYSTVDSSFDSCFAAVSKCEPILSKLLIQYNKCEKNDRFEMYSQSLTQQALSGKQKFKPHMILNQEKNLKDSIMSNCFSDDPEKYYQTDFESDYDSDSEGDNKSSMRLNSGQKVVFGGSSTHFPSQGKIFNSYKSREDILNTTSTATLATYPLKIQKSSPQKRLQPQPKSSNMIAISSKKHKKQVKNTNRPLEITESKPRPSSTSKRLRKRIGKQSPPPGTTNIRPRTSSSSRRHLR